MKKIHSIIAIILSLLLFSIMAIGSGDSSSSYSKYSDEYNNDTEYKKNVDHIADVYGKDSAEVDRKLNAVADAMK